MTSIQCEDNSLLFELRSASKSYFVGTEEVSVLNSLDLKVPRGDFVAVMGQSGSGKSTLMNILGCLDRPTKGTYILGGVDTAILPPAALSKIRNRTIGFVFQSFNLIKRMTLRDNIALPLLYAGMPVSLARAKALAELEQVGLKKYADRMPNQVSGGQQQRAAIARALVNDPPLLLADEPTGNLDSQTSDEIMISLQQLKVERGITIVLVTHEQSIAVYSNRLLQLCDGVIGFDGPTLKAPRYTQVSSQHLTS